MEYWNLSLNTFQSSSATCRDSRSFLHLTAFPEVQGWQVTSVLLIHRWRGPSFFLRFPSPTLYSPFLLSLPPAARHSNMYAVSQHSCVYCVCKRTSTQMPAPHSEYTHQRTKSVLCSILCVLGLQLKSSASLTSTLPCWAISEA